MSALQSRVIDEMFWMAVNASRGQIGQWIMVERVARAVRRGGMEMGKENVGRDWRDVRVRYVAERQVQGEIGAVLRAEGLGLLVLEAFWGRERFGLMSLLLKEREGSCMIVGSQREGSIGVSFMKLGMC